MTHTMRPLAAILVYAIAYTIPVKSMSTTTSMTTPTTTTITTPVTTAVVPGQTPNTTTDDMATASTTQPITQPIIPTTTEKTYSITKAELNTLIIAASCVLLILVILAAVCGCLFARQNRSHRRRHRYGVYYKHNDDDYSHPSYVNNDLFRPEVEQASGRDVYIPYSGEPITTHVMESSPASPPYELTTAIVPYSPYLYDGRGAQYARSVVDRPYRSNMEVVSKRGGDGNWMLSAPNLSQNIPRVWI